MTLTGALQPGQWKSRKDSQWDIGIEVRAVRPLVLAKVPSSKLNAITTTWTSVGADVYGVFSILSLVAELKPVNPFARRHNSYRCHRTPLRGDAVTS